MISWAVLVHELFGSLSTVVFGAVDASSLLCDKKGKSNANAILGMFSMKLNAVANKIFFKFIIRILYDEERVFPIKTITACGCLCCKEGVTGVKLVPITAIVLRFFLVPIS